MSKILFEQGKVPPQAIDIEEAILGAIILEGSAFNQVSHYFRDDGVFYKESHNIIINAIKEIIDNNGVIDMLTVTDKLRSKGKLDEVGGVMFITNLPSKIASTLHLEFHCRIITDKYLLREIIRISNEMIKKAYDEEDPSDIAEWGENQILEKFKLDIDSRNNFKDALHSTLMDITNKAKGITKNFIKTNDPEIDEKVSFREKSILLIAGAEGSGKTKYATYLVKNMLDNNSSIRVLWFSMEDSKEQIIRSFISMKTKLTTKELQSINYILTENDIENIHTTTNAFNDYKIEFIDRVSSIRNIIRKTKNLKDKYKEDTIVVVIDNLGLILTDSFYKSIERDDYLASKIKELSDETGTFIIVLHHITKDSAKAFNLKEGYRPRKEYIKGSTRILDYVQQAMLVNLPRKYKDLVAEEKDKTKIFQTKERTGKFDKTRFLMEFWSINPQGDKTTKGISDLQSATWDELKLCCAIEKKDNGDPIGAGYILNKYLEYSFYIDDINRHRDAQYKTEKISIYSFINNKKYKEDYSPKKDSRAYYLYGSNLNVVTNINDLFIAEIVKNRDGNDVEDQSLIRYKCNLDYNIFEPLISKIE